jgi:hypothetical protein
MRSNGKPSPGEAQGFSYAIARSSADQGQTRPRALTESTARISEQRRIRFLPLLVEALTRDLADVWCLHKGIPLGSRLHKSVVAERLRDLEATIALASTGEVGGPP